MVNLCESLCRLLGRRKVDTRDQDIADLAALLKQAIPKMEQNIDLKITIAELEAKLGNRKPYAGVY